MPYWCHTKIDECRLFHPTSHRVFTRRQISRPIFFMAFFMLLGHLFNWSLSEFWPPFHLIHPVPYYQSLLGTWPYVLAVSSISTLYKSMLLSALSSFLWDPGLYSLLSLPGAESMHKTHYWMEAWDEQHSAYGYIHMALPQVPACTLPLNR